MTPWSAKDDELLNRAYRAYNPKRTPELEDPGISTDTADLLQQVAEYWQREARHRSEEWRRARHEAERYRKLFGSAVVTAAVLGLMAVGEFVWFVVLP